MYRKLAAVLAATLALGLAACGSSSKSTGQSQADRGAQTSAQTSARTQPVPHGAKSIAFRHRAEAVCRHAKRALSAPSKSIADFLSHWLVQNAAMTKGLGALDAPAGMSEPFAKLKQVSGAERGVLKTALAVAKHDQQKDPNHPSRQLQAIGRRFGALQNRVREAATVLGLQSCRP